MNLKRLLLLVLCLGLLSFVSLPKSLAADSIKGKIGLGSWLTAVEYQDVKVTSNANGAVLFADDFSKSSSMKDWAIDKGEWKIKKGSMIQSSEDQDDCRIVVGDVNWTDITLSLKAKKISGKEGFLINFGYQDKNNYYHLNIGGWGNTKTAIEKTANGTHHLFVGAPIRQSIKDGQWYNIKIVIDGNNIQCYFDNMDKPIMDVVGG